MTRSTWSAGEIRTLLASVAHDLRTPLSVITGRASVLRASAADAQRHELDAIIEEARRVSWTLENLLAVTAAEDLLARDWVPVEELTGAVLARLERALAGRAVAIAVPDNLLVHVDPVLGELLLANLVERAATRATPGAPVELAARRDGGAVIVEIAHDGDGAPAAPWPLEATPANELGLAACRRIAVAHGGALELARRAGGGTLFHVRLPDGAPLPNLDDPVEVP